MSMTITASLPAATVGQPYSGSIAVSGAVLPVTISASGLPAGLSCSAGCCEGATSMTINRQRGA